MLQDSDRWLASLGAVPGAALYGLYHLAVLLREGRRPTLSDITNLILNIVCAVLCGVLLAFVLAKGVQFIPWPSLRDPFTLGFVIGAFGWELLPILFPKLARRAEQALDKIDGGNQ